MITKKATGQVSINRHDGGDTQVVEISIADASTMLPIASCQLSLEDFAKAITGISGMKGSLEVHDTFDKVGKTSTSKYINIKLTLHEYQTIANNRINKQVITTIVSKYITEEVKDGWILDEYYNSKGFLGERNTVRVMLIKYS